MKVRNVKVNVKVIVVGSLQTNCYILERGESVLIIDPGSDASLIASNIPSNKKVLGIIITHSHDDHTGALKELMDKYNTRLYNGHNLSEGHHVIDNFSFDVLHTPGHLDDSISIYFKEDKIMFVGDFIFKGGIGRTDLPGASAYDMKQSIKKILNYPKDITLMPGHFGVTLLGDEIDNLNYFLTVL